MNEKKIVRIDMSYKDITEEFRLKQNQAYNHIATYFLKNGYTIEQTGFILLRMLYKLENLINSRFTFTEKQEDQTDFISLRRE
jgi:hypothetical protein